MNTNNELFLKIQDLIEKLRPHDILTRFRGNCVAATDLIQNLLHQHGINSKIVEVQLTATKKYPDGNTEFMFVGYDNLRYPGQIDTHLVVITEHEIPLLIDASIGHILEGTSKDYVLEPVNSSEKFLSDITLDDVQLTYQIKKNIRLPALHQRTLIDRLLEEKKVKDTIFWLKILVITGLGMSLINMIANGILIILKLIFP